MESTTSIKYYEDKPGFYHFSASDRALLETYFGLKDTAKIKKMWGALLVKTGLLKPEDIEKKSKETPSKVEDKEFEDELNSLLEYFLSSFKNKMDELS